MTIGALLLDLDGTLVDTEPLNRAAYTAFFAARGWAAPDLAIFVGRRAGDVFSTEPGPWSGEDPDVLAAEVVAAMDPAAVPEHLPGARELLALDLPKAIVTSAGPDWVRRTAVADVDVLITADDVVDGKPDPTGFRLACERLGVDPAAAVAVEDSPAGIRAAVAAGVGVVLGVPTTHAAVDLTSAGASQVAADLREVVNWVREVMARPGLPGSGEATGDTWD